MPMPHRYPGPSVRRSSAISLAQYTCCNVVHYDGYQDTCSADTRSAVADGRVYTDSLTPVLHKFILTRFRLHCCHRRLGDLMVGLGSDPYLSDQHTNGAHEVLIRRMSVCDSSGFSPQLGDKPSIILNVQANARLEDSFASCLVSSSRRSFFQV
jgi:hypothetical protein